MLIILVNNDPRMHLMETYVCYFAFFDNGHICLTNKILQNKPALRMFTTHQWSIIQLWLY